MAAANEAPAELEIAVDCPKGLGKIEHAAWMVPCEFPERRRQWRAASSDGSRTVMKHSCKRLNVSFYAYRVRPGSMEAE